MTALRTLTRWVARTQRSTVDPFSALEVQLALARVERLIADLQREVDMRLREGAPFAQIEHDVIEPSALSEEDKSALWLYGCTRVVPPWECSSSSTRNRTHSERMRTRSRSRAAVSSTPSFPARWS